MRTYGSKDCRCRAEATHGSPGRSVAIVGGTGDHREQIVDISTPPADAESRIAGVREWLLAAGWAAPFDGNDWNLEGSVAVGALAIVLDPQSLPGQGSLFDPADVARALRAELTAALGGRWV